jgi:hypothetical protein
VHRRRLSQCTGTTGRARHWARDVGGWNGGSASEAACLCIRCGQPGTVLANFHRTSARLQLGRRASRPDAAAPPSDDETVAPQSDSDFASPHDVLRRGLTPPGRASRRAARLAAATARLAGAPVRHRAAPPSSISSAWSLPVSTGGSAPPRLMLTRNGARPALAGRLARGSGPIRSLAPVVRNDGSRAAANVRCQRKGRLKLPVTATGTEDSWVPGAKAVDYREASQKRFRAVDTGSPACAPGRILACATASGGRAEER